MQKYEEEKNTKKYMKILTQKSEAKTIHNILSVS